MVGVDNAVKTCSSVLVKSIVKYVARKFYALRYLAENVMTKETLITIRRHLIGALAEVEKSLTEVIREENAKIKKTLTNN